jgi:phage terminase large subunit-like protein
MRLEGVGTFVKFDQGSARLEADNRLQKLILTRQLVHNNNLQLTEHVLASSSEVTIVNGQARQRIKKAGKKKIDLAVCLSMACHIAARMNIG